MSSPSDGKLGSFITGASGMVFLGLLAIGIVIGSASVIGLTFFGNRISSGVDSGPSSPQQNVNYSPRTQEEKDFYHSLVQNAYQAQQDLSYGSSLLRQIVGGPNQGIVDLNKKEIGNLLADSGTLKQTVNVDSIKIIAPAPAGCDECASQAEAIKQDWKILSDQANHINQELLFLDGLQAVRNTQLKELDEIPDSSSSGSRMTEQEHVNRFRAQRQAYDKALNGYVALRPKAIDPKAKDELEKLINANLEVIKALDIVIEITPRHDNELSNESWKKVDNADSKEEREWHNMQKVLYDGFQLINNYLMNLQNPLDDFVARLPQEENDSINPEVSPAKSVQA